MKLADWSKTFKKENPIRIYEEINNQPLIQKLKKLRNSMLLIKVMSRTYFEKML